MKKNLDSSILQTKTVGTIIDLLKRAREVTRNNTRLAKDVNRDIDFVLRCYKTASNISKRGKRPTILSDNHFTGIYKVNL
tara:strand:+ start:96 stop:335 length:240 start_codon:yes stop_codon:yes gene_type:complete